MAEYMDYDDTLYDASEHSRGKKIRSWISIIISAAFLLSLVILVIVRLPQNVRTNFQTVKTELHELNKNGDISKNEFMTIHDAFEKDESFNVNSEFKEKFSIIYSIITTPRIDITTSKVMMFDSDGALTLAIPYIVSGDKTVSNDEAKDQVSGIVGVDFVVLPYSSTKDGVVTISAPIRFSMRYYNEKSGMHYVAGQYVKSDSFKLNFYTLSLITSGDENIKYQTVKLNLNDAISKSVADDESAYKTIVAKDGNINEYKLLNGGKRGDTFIEKQLCFAPPTTEVTSSLKFNDYLYSNMKSVEFNIPVSSKFSISVN